MEMEGEGCQKLQKYKHERFKVSKVRDTTRVDECRIDKNFEVYVYGL